MLIIWGATTKLASEDIRIQKMVKDTFILLSRVGFRPVYVSPHMV
ncbi:MAG TPA: hypothetical protein PKZ42_08915 [Syntrophales bacterium]|nr:hypothetical protein [Syntrophales bacterium]